MNSSCVIESFTKNGRAKNVNISLLRRFDKNLRHSPFTAFHVAFCLSPQRLAIFENFVTIWGGGGGGGGLPGPTPGYAFASNKQQIKW